LRQVRKAVFVIAKGNFIKNFKGVWQEKSFLLYKMLQFFKAKYFFKFESLIFL